MASDNPHQDPPDLESESESPAPSDSEKESSDDNASAAPSTTPGGQPRRAAQTKAKRPAKRVGEPKLTTLVAWKDTHATLTRHEAAAKKVYEAAGLHETKLEDVMRRCPLLAIGDSGLWTEEHTKKALDESKKGPGTYKKGNYFSCDGNTEILTLYKGCWQLMQCLPEDIVGAGCNLKYEIAQNRNANSYIWSGTFCDRLSELIVHDMWGGDPTLLALAIQYANIIDTDDRRPWRPSRPPICADPYLASFLEYATAPERPAGTSMARLRRSYEKFRLRTTPGLRSLGPWSNLLARIEAEARKGSRDSALASAEERQESPVHLISIRDLKIVIAALDSVGRYGWGAYTALKLAAKGIHGARSPASFPKREHLVSLRQFAWRREYELTMLRKMQRKQDERAAAQGADPAAARTQQAEGNASEQNQPVSKEGPEAAASVAKASASSRERDPTDDEEEGDDANFIPETQETPAKATEASSKAAKAGGKRRRDVSEQDDGDSSAAGASKAKRRRRRPAGVYELEDEEEDEEDEEVIQETQWETEALEKNRQAKEASDVRKNNKAISVQLRVMTREASKEYQAENDEPAVPESPVPEPSVSPSPAPEPPVTKTSVPEPPVPKPPITKTSVPEPRVPEPPVTKTSVPKPPAPKPPAPKPPVTKTSVPEQPVTEPLVTQPLVPEPPVQGQAALNAAAAEKAAESKLRVQTLAKKQEVKNARDKKTQQTKPTIRGLGFLSMWRQQDIGTEDVEPSYTQPLLPGPPQPVGLAYDPIVSQPRPHTGTMPNSAPSTPEGRVKPPPKSLPAQANPERMSGTGTKPPTSAPSKSARPAAGQKSVEVEPDSFAITIIEMVQRDVEGLQSGNDYGVDE